VIIGDPKQLPPVIQSCESLDAHHFSLFSKIQLERDLIQMNVTYRLNDTLAHWVGESFYSGNLEAAETARNRKLHLDGEPSSDWLETVLSPETSLVWLPSKTTTTRNFSMEETDLINQIVSELKQRGFRMEELGIVTPFRRQARTIRRRLQANPKLILEETAAITVDTVERMQGQERSVILVSTAASDPGFITALEEFLFLPQRLNVAVSRAKVKVIILSSDNFISNPSPHPEINDAILHWKNLFDSSTVVRI
jgi:DNA replication ATP-dependent helicase Dna2